MAKKSEDTQNQNSKEGKPEKAPKGNSAPSKPWHRTPVATVGLVVLLLVVGVSGYMFYSSSSTNETNEPQMTMDELVEESNRLSAAGDSGAAIVLWENANSNTSDENEQAQNNYHLASIYISTGDYQKALEILQAVEGTDSDIQDYALYTALVQSAMGVDDKQLAIEYIDKVISSIPEADPAYELEVSSYEDLKEQLQKEI